MIERIKINSTQALRLIEVAGGSGPIADVNRQHVQAGIAKGYTLEVIFDPQRKPGQREVCRLAIGGLRQVKLYSTRARGYLAVHYSKEAPHDSAI